MSSGASAPTRLLNKQVNPYWGMVVKNSPQVAVYIQGQTHPPGFEGGLPTWIPLEFPSVPAYDAQDGVISLPAGFTLLCLLEYSTQAAGFAMQVYDVASSEWLSDKLADSRLMAGQLGVGILDRIPHTFEPDAQGNDAQLFIRITNQASVAADIMVAAYGVVGGAAD